METKSEGKHTPGGWTFRGMFEPTGDKMTYQIIGGVTKSEAILMAAAPELLEACKRWAESHGLCNCFACAKGKAAIAKAEEK